MPGNWLDLPANLKPLAIRFCEGERGGGVAAVSSARWTGFDSNLWPGDRADEIGHDLDRPLQPPDPATLERYAAIVQQF